MPQAIIDPGEVRDFARLLAALVKDVTDSLRRVQFHFGQLGETWRDEEYQRFANELNDAVRTLQQFIAASTDYVTFLGRKADAAEEYLRTR